MLLKPIVPLMEYIVFYDYIKNELCVNKDKTELNCNGKCYLAKQLAKASEKEKDGHEKKTFSIETNIVFYQDISKNVGFQNFNINPNNNILAYYNTLYDHLIITNLLRPPIGLV